MLILRLLIGQFLVWGCKVMLQKNWTVFCLAGEGMLQKMGKVRRCWSLWIECRPAQLGDLTPVFFFHTQDAIKAIIAVCNTHLDGRTLK